MNILNVVLAFLVVTSVLHAHEIKISASGGSNGKFYSSREEHNGDISSIVLSGKGYQDIEFSIDPIEYCARDVQSKHICEWKDLYNLAHDAMKKNIIEGTAVDYFEHNNERFQRTVKWEGTNKDNFSLVITIDKQ